MIRPARFLAAATLFASLRLVADPASVVDWRFDRVPPNLSGAPLTVTGTPAFLAEPGLGYTQFNGTTDGYFIDRNPIEGWSQFTLEIRIRADADGEYQPRFLNIQGHAGGWMTLEFRLNKNTWALDAFVTEPQQRLKLFDETKVHSAGVWHWIALTYDGKVMTTYVDGVKDLSGEVALKPIGPGHMSLGARLNQIDWFKGGIAELRATPRALAPGELSH